MATDKDNKLATFSNLGGDFVAPGVSNYSTYVGDRYAYLSGTSMASPHVAGAVALVLSHEKVSSPVEALEVIQTNVVDLGVEGKDSVFGYGLVDLVAAFESLAEEEPESDDVTDSPSEEEGDIDDNEDSKEENNDGDEDDTDKDNNGKDNDKKPLVQHIEITSHDDKRIVLEEGSEEDVTLEFGLDPVSEDSTLDEIVVYIDNDEVYTTKLQEDSYVLENEELGSAQYIIRIEATFENKSKKIVTVLLDTTAFDNREENNKANPGRARNKSILGAATRFQY
jgi:hypothetical protein